jgi:phosphoribosylaminoimidazole-succinocarboxamide synthase
MIQRRVETCNLEVRVKRYHIGSPFHRYRYAEEHATTQSCGPLRRWARLDRPVVCFDWRHPMTDKEGKRLADEPISDDYAAVWMENVPHAREMARTTFLWLEELFAKGGFILVDICYFIDRDGRLLYGEISPDCMRIRRRRAEGSPETAEALDKDVWRSGGSPEEVLAQYQEISRVLFREPSSVRAKAALDVSQARG